MTRHRSPRRRSHPRSSWGFTFLGGNSRNSRPASRHNGSAQTALSRQWFPLTQAHPGDRLWIAELQQGKPCTLNPGNELTVINRTSSGSVIVEVAGERLGFCQSRADSILVSAQPLSASDRGLTHLHAMQVGSTGRVKCYDCPCRSYRKRLLAMGLTPGTEFTVTRHAPLGDPVEIKVRGFSLSLRKDEARALLVEAVR